MLGVQTCLPLTQLNAIDVPFEGLQDMPAMYWEDPFSQGESYRGHGEKAQFEHELTRMIDVSIQNLV